MIRRIDGERPAFVIETENTSYILSITPSGHAAHLYYGRKISAASQADLDVIAEKRQFPPGNTIVYSEEYPTEVPEDMLLEISACGHGDIREPFVEILRENGCRSSDFIYSSAEITDVPLACKTLPTAINESGSCERLCLTLADDGVLLELNYVCYPECDVITRSARLINESGKTVKVNRLMSQQLDIPVCGLCITSFHGAWVREMQPSTVALPAGKLVLESRTGTSSSRTNPFFMVHDKDTTEAAGDCYGFNLIYSGNHYSAVEVSSFGKTRIVSGIQPEGFQFVLEPGRTLEAPEAVMTYTNGGFRGQSRNMHRFVKEHIIRGKWKNKPRPVLLNSWEACYFNISESVLVSLAKTGRDLGTELFVMDDGWFGERNDDRHSLGDWEASVKKLPKGLAGLSKRICDLGIGFGIWVEPEMVNTESKLYKEHPDWAMAIPDKLHSEGRNQRLLDLCSSEVTEYIISKMKEVFSSGNISYVKWDMNRIFSDAYSPSLPAERQGETAHRYVCGLYRMMSELTAAFPDILFEGCASGGNRFDLGMLCYFPQIWASDNTDAVSRAAIQEGYSYGYPQCCIGSHVSASPNHQTLRVTPPDTRFAVAAFGLLGYECDVRDLSADIRKMIRSDIELYKQWRDVLQFGDFYRLETGNVHKWICVSQDKKRAVGMLLQELAVPNRQYEVFRAEGLDPELTYRFRSIQRPMSLKQFGSMINTMTPMHIRQDSALHNVIAKAVKLSTEQEELYAKGSTLMEAGVALSQAFSGTGFNDNVRVFPDFSARLYLIESTGA